MDAWSDRPDKDIDGSLKDRGCRVLKNYASSVPSDMKHFQLEDFNKDNLQYYVDKPDKNFNPQRNYAIINQTIKEYEQMRFGIDPKVTKAAGDRADILASFAKYKLDFGGGKKIEQYLSKSHFNQIAGEGIIRKIKMLEQINNLKKLQRKKMRTLPKGIYI